MGIDIYARWLGQTEEEIAAQQHAEFSTILGHVGYLREAYRGGPYATLVLCREAFIDDFDAVGIPASLLRKRLAETLARVEDRARNIYGFDDKTVEEWKQSFRDFVALCEAKELETGEPIHIIADY